MAQPLEMILMRELADHLATPIFVVDLAGDLTFYNEGAEKLLGTRFEETGGMPFAQWSTMFTPTDETGASIPPDDLPLAVALRDRRPVHGDMRIRSVNGELRALTVTAIPLEGQFGDHLGAAAVFWEP